MTEGDGLQPCSVPGCPWRGKDPDDCPMHEEPGRSSIRKLMMPGDVVNRRNTRRR
jgi:hypothetical protein